MFLGTLDACLLGNILTDKEINRAREGAITTRQGRGIVRAGYGNKKDKKNQQKDKIMKTKWVFNASSSFN